MSAHPTVHVAFHRPGLRSPREELAVYTRKLLTGALELRSLPLAEVSVLFCSASRMAELHRTHLGEDHATDVLSFPALDDPKRAPRAHTIHLGDIAVCLPVCARQAPDFERTTDQEVALLLVHGLLHLLGYDHDVPARKRAMWAETDRILEAMSRIRAPRLSVVIPRTHGNHATT